MRINDIICELSSLEDGLAAMPADGEGYVIMREASDLICQARQRLEDHIGLSPASTQQCVAAGTKHDGHTGAKERIISGENNRETLLTLLENSIDAVYSRDLITDSYDYMSPVFERITGFSVEEMVVMKMQEVMERIHPDDRAAVRKAIKFVNSGGKGMVEYRFMGKDGHYRWLADAIYVQADQQGRPICRLGIVRDVTEQKRREQSLRESEDRYRSLVDMSPDALFINVNGRIVFVNPALLSMFGAESADQIIGKTPYDLLHPDCHPVVRERIKRLLAGENAPLIEEKILRMDGRVVDVEVAASHFNTNEGTALQVIMRDITDRKRAEEKLVERQRQLEELNRTLEQRVEEETRKSREKDYLLIQQSRQAEMGEMINIIAHQWRQPLNVIGLFAQMLTETSKHGELDEAYLDGTVKQILDILAHMSQTIDDFRNFLKPDRERKRFNVKEIISRTYDLISASFKAQDIHVEIVGDDDLALTGYANEYAQVVMNILNNAKDALQDRNIEQPSISIMVWREGTRAVVTITDNAGGIDEDLHERIFEPYFTTKQERTGSGIGLYMSKTIIENSMHGCLTVRNAGTGAEFRIEV
ncbi:MAG: PAS domain S-box protein [Geobacteraceae bacterium]|nr:PAS domain S-box protein [Geobacteraceae bacterium]